MTRSLGKALGIVVLTAVLIVGSSCTSVEGRPQQSAIEITDQLGRAVKLDTVPQRIVSLAPSNTEMLFALGLGDRVVGVDTYSDFPPEAKEKPKVGGFSTPDIEKILALSPDLVIAADTHKEKAIPEMERHGLKVLALAPKTLNDVTEAIELLSKAAGAEQQAQLVLQNMRRRVDAVSGLVADLPSEARPRVFYVLWHDPLKTAGQGTLQSQLMELAGGKNVFDDLSGYPAVSLEVLLERQPQVMIAAIGHGSGQEGPLEWAKSEPRLRDTEALSEGRVSDIDANIVSRAGPRIVDGLEQMFLLIHPELTAALKKQLD